MKSSEPATVFDVSQGIWVLDENAAEDDRLDWDELTAQRGPDGPTPEEYLHRIECSQADEIAEVLRHWLEGADHAQQ